MAITDLENHLEPEPARVKPKWRGWIHAGTFPVAIAGGVVLIVLAHGWVAKTAAAIFMFSSLLLFGISALYHRFNWSEKVKLALKRLDHANIFVLIAGTYTPMSLLALPLDKGLFLLIMVWALTVLGILFQVFWIQAPRWIYVPLYVLLGWAAVWYLGDFAQVNVAMVVLMIVGGGLYTLGAVIYGTKWPNPSPKNFGFHEIFHALTTLAFLCHWTAALLICLNPAYPL